MKAKINKTISKDIHRIKDVDFFSEETVTDLLLSELRKHENIFTVTQIRDKNHEGKIGADFLLKYKDGRSVSFQAKKVLKEKNKLTATYHLKKASTQINAAAKHHKTKLDALQTARYDQFINLLLSVKQVFNQADLQFLDFLFHCIDENKIFWPLTIFYVCPAGVKSLKKDVSSHTLAIANSLQLIASRISSKEIPFDKLEPYLFQVPNEFTFEGFSDRYYLKRFMNKNFFQGFRIFCERKRRSFKGYFLMNKRKVPKNREETERELKKNISGLTQSLEQLIQDAPVQFTQTLFYKKSLHKIKEIISEYNHPLFPSGNTNLNNLNSTDFVIFYPSHGIHIFSNDSFFEIFESSNKIRMQLEHLRKKEDDILIEDLKNIEKLISNFFEHDWNTSLVSPEELFPFQHFKNIQMQIETLLEENPDRVIQDEKNNSIAFIKYLNDTVQKLSTISP